MRVSQFSEGNIIKGHLRRMQKILWIGRLMASEVFNNTKQRDGAGLHASNVIKDKLG